MKIHAYKYFMFVIKSTISIVFTHMCVEELNICFKFTFEKILERSQSWQRATQVTRLTNRRKFNELDKIRIHSFIEQMRRKNQKRKRIWISLFLIGISKTFLNENFLRQSFSIFSIFPLLLPRYYAHTDYFTCR